MVVIEAYFPGATYETNDATREGGRDGSRPSRPPDGYARCSRRGCTRLRGSTGLLDRNRKHLDRPIEIQLEWHRLIEKSNARHTPGNLNAS